MLKQPLRHAKLNFDSVRFSLRTTKLLKGRGNSFQGCVFVLEEDVGDGELLVGLLDELELFDLSEAGEVALEELFLLGEEGGDLRDEDLALLLQ